MKIAVQYDIVAYGRGPGQPAHKPFPWIVQQGVPGARTPPAHRQPRGEFDTRREHTPPAYSAAGKMKAISDISARGTLVDVYA